MRRAINVRNGLALALLAALTLLALSGLAPAQQKDPYTTFVACDYDLKRLATIRKTHFCPAGEVVGAFFRRNVGEPGSLVRYTVCVAFSQGGNDCATGVPARKRGRRLYVNRIIGAGPGRHRVTWFVQGERVGLWYFRRGR
jgi:hypothetical protein